MRIFGGRRDIKVKESSEIAKHEFKLLTFRELHELHIANQDSPLWERANFQDEYFKKIPGIVKGKDLPDILREAYHPEDFQHIQILLDSITGQLGLETEYKYRAFGKNSTDLHLCNSSNDKALFKLKDLDVKPYRKSSGYGPDIEVLINIPRMVISPGECGIPDSPFPEATKTTLEIISKYTESYRNILAGGWGSTTWESFLLTEDGMMLEAFAELYSNGKINRGPNAYVYFYRIFKPEDVPKVNLREAVQEAHQVFQLLDRYFEIKKQLVRDEIKGKIQKITDYLEKHNEVPKLEG